MKADLSIMKNIFPVKITRLFGAFFESEKAAGFTLLGVTMVSLFLANSAFSEKYTALWNYNMGGHTVVEWINDGLMTIFFLMIGLELEREIYVGELSNLRNASLPFFGALGGMLMPAGIYVFFNYGLETMGGSGIPTATDIAFAVAILSMLGNKVPLSLKVFLVALAIVDDLAAIIVISVFYTSNLSFLYLFFALGVFAILLVLNRLRIYNILPYLLGGLLMWFFMLNSGVHATISGVLLAFAIPFKNGNEDSPSEKLLHFLHKPVAFFVLPLFAIANSGFTVEGDLTANLLKPYSLGIMLGLFVGKPLGIFLFAWLGEKMKLCSLPEDLKWVNIIAVGFLGGIGFTMAIFISLLAFQDYSVINGSKIAVLTASIFSGIVGYLFLLFTLKNKST